MHPRFRVQLSRLTDDDPIHRGGDDPFIPQIAKDPGNDRANRTNRVGQLLLGHLYLETPSLLAGCSQIQQMARDPLQQRAKGVTGQSIQRIIKPAGDFLRHQPAYFRFGLCILLQHPDIEHQEHCVGQNLGVYRRRPTNNCRNSQQLAGSRVAHGDLAALRFLVEQAHEAGLFIGLAGALRARDLAGLRDIGADIIGLRSAVCLNHHRNEPLDPERVRQLHHILVPVV